MLKPIIYSIAVALAGFVGCAQQANTSIPVEAPASFNFEVEVVVPDVASPWGMAFLPDGGLLVTDRSGSLLHFKDGVSSPIGGLPDIDVRGQGGLMDIVLHPRFEDNGWIYLTYASPEGTARGSNTAVMRGQLKDGSLIEQEVLYKAEPNSTSGRHFGSRMAFDNEGYLYFSIGERGERDRDPQDLTRDGGKVYRIHDDGRIPADNPFVDESKAKTAIFSYGHRNPQGMVKHPETGDIWTHEHGPRGGDEINIVRKGRNYGWPVITFGINYGGSSITDKTAAPGMEQPLFFWVPSIAPSGMAFVTSDRYPHWKDSLLVGSLKFAYLERLELADGQVTRREKLLDGEGRVRDVRQGPDGFIYVAVEGTGILRIVPR